MDLVYTTPGRQELGIMQNYALDLDMANTKDFSLVASLSDVLLAKGCYVYVPGTEYGGRVDDYKINNKKNQITYSGRNWRGFLESYIIEPPSGSDYLTVTGTLSDITTARLEAAGITALFTADSTSATVTSFSFARYIGLYSGLVALASEADKVLTLEYVNGMVHISFEDINDYSESIEYSQDSGIYFILNDKAAGANHLICLGSGLLASREVLHLYVQADGTIGTTKYYIGLEEVTQKFDYPNAESSADLEAKGREVLAEQASGKSFKLTAENLELKIGDIVGARDRVTDTVMTEAVTNIIVKIKDGIARQSYTIGG